MIFRQTIYRLLVKLCMLAMFLQTPRLQRKTDQQAPMLDAEFRKHPVCCYRPTHWIKVVFHGRSTFDCEAILHVPTDNSMSGGLHIGRAAIACT